MRVSTRQLLEHYLSAIRAYLLGNLKNYKQYFCTQKQQNKNTGESNIMTYVNSVSTKDQHTCKTSNPNYYHPSDSDLSTLSAKSYFIGLALISCEDQLIYNCDDPDCDHEFCTPVSVFNITRSDCLLFPDLLGVKSYSVWQSEYTGWESDYDPYDDHENQANLHYALGL
jgi:hypothetical protein